MADRREIEITEFSYDIEFEGHEDMISVDQKMLEKLKRHRLKEEVHDEKERSKS